jgi:uncharacterized protein (DUF427 family)
MTATGQASLQKARLSRCRTASATTSTCPRKGAASYYSLEVGGQVNRDAAWAYRDPKPAAAEIAGHVAFWRGVEVTAS